MRHIHPIAPLALLAGGLLNGCSWCHHEEEPVSPTLASQPSKPLQSPRTLSAPKRSPAGRLPPDAGIDESRPGRHG